MVWSCLFFFTTPTMESFIIWSLRPMDTGLHCTSLFKAASSLGDLYNRGKTLFAKAFIWTKTFSCPKLKLRTSVAKCKQAFRSWSKRRPSAALRQAARATTGSTASSNSSLSLSRKALNTLKNRSSGRRCIRSRRCCSKTLPTSEVNLNIMEFTKLDSKGTFCLRNSWGKWSSQEAHAPNIAITAVMYLVSAPMFSVGFKYFSLSWKLVILTAAVTLSGNTDAISTICELGFEQRNFELWKLRDHINEWHPWKWKHEKNHSSNTQCPQDAQYDGPFRNVMRTAGPRERREGCCNTNKFEPLSKQNFLNRIGWAMYGLSRVRWAKRSSSFPFSWIKA